MKKKIIFTAIILIVFCVLISFFLIQRKSQGIYGSGMIEVKEIEISTKVSGQIKEIRVEEGDYVKQGDTLVIIDHRELLAQKEEAMAGIQVAEQTLNEIELTKKDLEKNVQRIRNLYTTGDVPEKELESIETQLKVLIAQENKAKASLKAAQARLNLIQTQIENAYILSPISGVVLANNFEKGELVFQGARLLKIGDLNSAWLKIYIVERDVSKVSLGAKANVYVDAYPKQVFSGGVTWISSEAEFTPKNIQTKEERSGLVFAIKIAIPNANQKLLPGMPADAEIVENVHR